MNDIFNPKESSHKWLRYPMYAINKKHKEIILAGLVNELNDNIKTKEDFVLWLNFVKSGIKIYALDNNLVYWTKLEDSLSSSFFQKLKDAITVYNTYMKFNYIKSLYLTFILSVNFLRKNYN